MQISGQSSVLLIKNYVYLKIFNFAISLLKKFSQPLKTNTYLVATVDRPDIRPIYHERIISIKSVRG